MVSQESVLSSRSACINCCGIEVARRFRLYLGRHVELKQYKDPMDGLLATYHELISDSDSRFRTELS